MDTLRGGRAKRRGLAAVLAAALLTGGAAVTAVQPAYAATSIAT
ncbi:hypothetical protein [Phytohabitans rumicis]|nr:hypothetical protein [Phytohabitans rumicis]